VSAPAPSELSYRGYRYPAEIISYAVWLYYRFSLSLRDVEELLAERGRDCHVRDDPRLVRQVRPKLCRPTAPSTSSDQ
jgi:transposase-like protein